MNARQQVLLFRERLMATKGKPKATGPQKWTRCHGTVIPGEPPIPTITYIGEDGTISAWYEKDQTYFDPVPGHTVHDGLFDAWTRGGGDEIVA